MHIKANPHRWADKELLEERENSSRRLRSDGQGRGKLPTDLRGPQYFLINNSKAYFQPVSGNFKVWPPQFGPRPPGQSSWATTRKVEAAEGRRRSVANKLEFLRGASVIRRGESAACGLALVCGCRMRTVASGINQPLCKWVNTRQIRQAVNFKRKFAPLIRHRFDFRAENFHAVKRIGFRRNRKDRLQSDRKKSLRSA